LKAGSVCFGIPLLAFIAPNFFEYRARSTKARLSP
jgi:hypothetical protein